MNRIERMYANFLLFAFGQVFEGIFHLTNKKKKQKNANFS